TPARAVVDPNRLTTPSTRTAGCEDELTRRLRQRRARPTPRTPWRAAASRGGRSEWRRARPRLPTSGVAARRAAARVRRPGCTWGGAALGGLGASCTLALS